MSISLLADFSISGGAEAFRPESDRSLVLEMGLFGDGDGFRPESDRSRARTAAAPFCPTGDCIPGSLSLLRDGELLTTDSLTEPGRMGSVTSLFKRFCYQQNLILVDVMKWQKSNAVA